MDRSVFCPVINHGLLIFFLVCHSLIWVIACTGARSGRFDGEGREIFRGLNRSGESKKLLNDSRYDRR